jgi:prevent-host-death family protein
MTRASAAEVQKNFGRYRDVAAREAVVVTAHGKPSVVILSANEYARLKELDRRVVRFADMTDADLGEMAKATIPARYRYSIDDIPD